MPRPGVGVVRSATVAPAVTWAEIPAAILVAILAATPAANLVARAVAGRTLPPGPTMDGADQAVITMTAGEGRVPIGRGIVATAAKTLTMAVGTRGSGGQVARERGKAASGNCIGLVLRPVTFSCQHIATVLVPLKSALRARTHGAHASPLC